MRANVPLPAAGKAVAGRSTDAGKRHMDGYTLSREWTPGVLQGAEWGCSILSLLTSVLTTMLFLVRFF